jgi:plasmid stabilization system protein ParE
MQIRWSPEAADDFESAKRRILQDNPSNDNVLRKSFMTGSPG